MDATVVTNADGPWHEVVQGLLRSMDDLVSRQCEEVYSFPAYSGMPQEDVAASARRNVLRAVAVLRGEPGPLGDLAEGEEETARRRALQGVPSADMLAAYRRGFVIIRDAAFAECQRAGLSTELILQAASLLWECADRHSATFLAAQHRVEMDLARREENRRVVFLGQLLLGTLTAEEAADSGVSFGFSLSEEYWVARIRLGDHDLPTTATNVDAVIRHRDQPILVGPYERDIVAVTRHQPASVPPGATGGVGGPALLGDLPRAFQRASHALTTALAFGMNGLYDEARLSARTAVLDQPQLSEMFLRHYVDPVESGSGMAGAVLDSVDAYLSYRRSLPDAARALSIHVNTLRYRLGRYCTMTGADLDDVECEIEVWWALRARELRLSTHQAL